MTVAGELHTRVCLTGLCPVYESTQLVLGLEAYLLTCIRRVLLAGDQDDCESDGVVKERQTSRCALAPG